MAPGDRRRAQGGADVAHCEPHDRRSAAHGHESSDRHDARRGCSRGRGRRGFRLRLHQGLQRPVARGVRWNRRCGEARRHQGGRPPPALRRTRSRGRRRAGLDRPRRGVPLHDLQECGRGAHSGGGQVDARRRHLRDADVDRVQADRYADRGRRSAHGSRRDAPGRPGRQCSLADPVQPLPSRLRARGCRASPRPARVPRAPGSRTPFLRRAAPGRHRRRRGVRRAVRAAGVFAPRGAGAARRLRPVLLRGAADGDIQCGVLHGPAGGVRRRDGGRAGRSAAPRPQPARRRGECGPCGGRHGARSLVGAGRARGSSRRSSSAVSRRIRLRRHARGRRGRCGQEALSRRKTRRSASAPVSRADAESVGLRASWTRSRATSVP